MYGTDANLNESSEVFATLIAATPTVYGLTAAQATAYGTLNTAYREAYALAKAPTTRSYTTILAKNDAKAALKAYAVELAKIVGGNPAVTNEQKGALGLSVRATPGPVAQPGTPEQFTLILPGNGDVLLKWKCKNPTGATGTMYQVWRKTAADTEYKFLGGVGAKKFTDTTLAAGATEVSYQVQAVRSTAAGFWGTFDAKFGKSVSGETFATVTERPARLAA